MSYFEYIFNGEVTTLLEEQTKNIFDIINNGTAPFVLDKYYDEEINEKKMRTIILKSKLNMVPHILFNLFNGSKVYLQAYHKISLI